MARINYDILMEILQNWNQWTQLSESGELKMPLLRGG